MGFLFGTGSTKYGRQQYLKNKEDSYIVEACMKDNWTKYEGKIITLVVELEEGKTIPVISSDIKDPTKQHLAGFRADFENLSPEQKQAILQFSEDRLLADDRPRWIAEYDAPASAKLLDQGRSVVVHSHEEINKYRIVKLEEFFNMYGKHVEK